MRFTGMMIITSAVVLHIGCTGCRDTGEMSDRPVARLRALVKVCGGHMNKGRLSSLDLTNKAISAEQLRMIVNHPGAESLISIDIGDTRVGDAGLKAIADSPHVGHVMSLYAPNIGATSAGARALANARVLRPTRVSLYSNRIGPDGAKALASSAAMARVEVLSLGSNPIGSQGVRAIAAGHWRGLKSLSLEMVQLDDAGLKELLTSHSLRNLDRLSIGSPDCNAHNKQIPFDCYSTQTLGLLGDPKNLPKLNALKTSHPVTLPQPIRDRLRAARPKVKIGL